MHHITRLGKEVWRILANLRPEESTSLKQRNDETSDRYIFLNNYKFKNKIASTSNKEIMWVQLKNIVFVFF